MRKLFIIVLSLSTSLTTLIAQEYSKEFGVVAKAEYDLEEYDPDTDAEAVVLFDFGKSHFVRRDNNFDVIYERTTRIKVLKEAGIDYAEVEIPFYQEGDIYERVYDVEAYTYNYEDGRVERTSFDEANIYEETVNTFWKSKKFALPNVKPGSIIEYRYKISSQYKFNFRDWEFQWRIPVVYSEYTTMMIPFYAYIYLLQGATKFDVYEEKQSTGLKRQFGSIEFSDMVYKYGMHNVPAFKDEGYITSINDYILKLDFQLATILYPDGTSLEILSSWEDMIKDLLKHEDFGKYINKSERFANKLIDMEGMANQSELEKVNYILDYVKNNYNWDGINAKYAYKSPNKFAEDKVGNSADINLFTIGLLRSIGIEAYPIVLSTRKHGKIKYDYPFSQFFNYVAIIATVDGHTILSDATDGSCMNLRLPIRCINDQGLIINKDEVSWANLEFNSPSKKLTHIFIDSVTNGSLKALILQKATEFDALIYRKRFSDDLAENLKELTKNDYEIIDTSISVKNLKERDKTFSIKYALEASYEEINDKIYISPFLEEIISVSPLQQKIRTYPVDLVYIKKRAYSSVIILPNGYSIEYLPKDVKISNSLFDLNYKVTMMDKRIQINFDYYFKKATYQPEEYARIKYYFNEVVKKGSDKVVLAKDV